MTKKKKILIGVSVFFACALLIAAVYIQWIMPPVQDIDKSLIVKNPDYNVFVEERNGVKTLVKKDAAGNILDTDFKVIGFTDTHLDMKKEKSDVTMEYIIRNVVNEKPDLVVFVGDNITGGLNWRRVRQLARVMEKLGVYWDLVLGNHEGDNFWSDSRPYMVRVFASYDHCLAEAGKKRTSDGEKVWGSGNHVINIANSKGVTRSLYFIDGGAYMSDEDMIKYDAEFDDKDHNDYDYVKDSQIKWYSETVAAIDAAEGRRIKSTVFDHIPLPEYTIAYNEITGETEPTSDVPAYNVKNENGDYIIMGQRRETICCSGHNSHFFDAILKAGSTDLFVSGHDHVNDFVLSYKGVILSYNVPSGYSSYNMVTTKRSDRLIRGFTRYYFKGDGSFEIEQVHNADLYPDAQAEILKLYEE
ncbi:MAG: metallophosphoesterase [Lachnospiraceae bacterium]|nr:metallophosphoesterase [Lachnospiraceae bacterium]